MLHNLVAEFKKRDAARDDMLVQYGIPGQKKVAYVMDPCKHIMPSTPCGNLCPKCGVVLTKYEKLELTKL